MFGKLFGRKKESIFTKDNEDKKRKEAAIEAGMQEAIKKQSKEDPLIGLKIGAKELNHVLLEALKDEKGVRIEDALGILGSIGGNLCLINAVMKANQLSQQGHKAISFHTLTGADGQTYFIGDVINEYLLSHQYSLWSLSAGVAENLGTKNLPDPVKIIEKVAGTLGGEDFGKPDLPEQHRLSDTPQNYVQQLSPKFLPVIGKRAGGAQNMPIVVGIAIQELIKDGAAVLDPGTAVKIVMECAIPMSRKDVAGHLKTANA